jgi:hypothetical protein
MRRVDDYDLQRGLDRLKDKMHKEFELWRMRRETVTDTVISGSSFDAFLMFLLRRGILKKDDD